MRGFSWIVGVLAAGLPFAAEAGQVEVIAQTGINTTCHSISADARAFGVATANGMLYDFDRVAGILLVNHASGSPTSLANGTAGYPILSADGAFLAFRSTANNLVPGQAGNVGTDNVFLFNAATGQNTLLSQRQAPDSPTPDYFPNPPAISADGRYIAFDSNAPDLIAGQVDTAGNPGTGDVFLYDRVTGVLTLVSHATGSQTVAANGPSHRPVLSADGNYVLFSSRATNLLPGLVMNGEDGLFLYDRVNGTTILVSHASNSPTTSAAGLSFGNVISSDGRYVAFSSNAGNLVTGQVDPVASLDVFLFDRVSGTTTLVSRKTGFPATAGNGNSGRPSMSADGRYIAFDSQASDMAEGVTDQLGSLDTFVYDRVADTMTLVSHAAGAPNQAAGSSYSPQISADGSVVTFVSYSENHLADQTGNSGMPDLFLFDRASGAIVLVTRFFLSATQEANYGFYPGPENWFVSDEGRYVAFASSASNLIPNDVTGGTQDVFAFDNGLHGRFFTLAPCRLVDTRQQADSPALSSGVTRTWTLHDACGLPATAKAVAVNVTVTQPTGAGHLTLWTGDAATPEASTINFGPGQTRANSAILALASNGAGTLKALSSVSSSGTAHVLLDVVGYFE